MINGLPLDDAGADAVRAMARSNGDGFVAVAEAAVPVIGAYLETIPARAYHLDESYTDGAMGVPCPPYIEGAGRRWNLTNVVLSPSPLATYTEIEV